MIYSMIISTRMHKGLCPCHMSCKSCVTRLSAEKAKVKEPNKTRKNPTCIKVIFSRYTEIDIAIAIAEGNTSLPSSPTEYQHPAPK